MPLQTTPILSQRGATPSLTSIFECCPTLLFSGLRDLESSLISGDSDGGPGSRGGGGGQNEFNVVSPMHLHAQGVVPKAKVDITPKNDPNPPLKGVGTVVPKGALPPIPVAPIPAVVEPIVTFEVDENYDDDDDDIEGEGEGEGMNGNGSGSINNISIPLISSASAIPQSVQNNILAPNYAPPPIPFPPHGN